jgi:hypothetical protein
VVELRIQAADPVHDIGTCSDGPLLIIVLSGRKSASPHRFRILPGHTLIQRSSLMIRESTGVIQLGYNRWGPGFVG